MMAPGEGSEELVRVNPRTAFKNVGPPSESSATLGPSLYFGCHGNCSCKDCSWVP